MAVKSPKMGRVRSDAPTFLQKDGFFFDAAGKTHAWSAKKKVSKVVSVSKHVGFAHGNLK